MKRACCLGKGSVEAWRWAEVALEQGDLHCASQCPALAWLWQESLSGEEHGSSRADCWCLVLEPSSWDAILTGKVTFLSSSVHVCKWNPNATDFYRTYRTQPCRNTLSLVLLFWYYGLYISCKIQGTHDVCGQKSILWAWASVSLWLVLFKGRYKYLVWKGRISEL